MLHNYYIQSEVVVLNPVSCQCFREIQPKSWNIGRRSRTILSKL